LCTLPNKIKRREYSGRKKYDGEVKAKTLQERGYMKKFSRMPEKEGEGYFVIQSKTPSYGESESVPETMGRGAWREK